MKIKRYDSEINVSNIDVKSILTNISVDSSLITDDALFDELMIDGEYIYVYSKGNNIAEFRNYEVYSYSVSIINFELFTNIVMFITSYIKLSISTSGTALSSSDTQMDEDDWLLRHNVLYYKDNQSISKLEWLYEE